jgi:hypothetical protein
MYASSLKENFEHIVTQTAEIAHEVNSSLDCYESLADKCSQTEKVLELGALLSSVRRGRRQALELLRVVPSPKQVPSHLGEEVAGIAKALFGFIHTCDQRAAIINRIVLGLDRSVAT